jgi:rod shape-determining protein MreC
MFKKPHYLISVLVVLLVAVLVKLPGGTMGKAKLAISGLFLPLFGLAVSTHATTAHAADSFVSKTELTRQNDALRRENVELKFLLQQDAALRNENARLRKWASWAPQRFSKGRLARVIARDPANWWRSVEIDLGGRDGIKTNDAVLTPDGLVGRIQSVGQMRSVVILLGDPGLRVAALIPNNGKTGIINSSLASPPESDMVEMDYLTGGGVVQKGQTVETWGEGGVFPAHIPIGTIVDVRVKESGLAPEARVRLAADIGALQEVWVMTP